MRMTESQRALIAKALDEFIKARMDMTDTSIEELESAVDLLARIDDSDFPLPATGMGHRTELF